MKGRGSFGDFEIKKKNLIDGYMWSFKLIVSIRQPGTTLEIRTK